jgi:hypothetical protein
MLHRGRRRGLVPSVLVAAGATLWSRTIRGALTTSARRQRRRRERRANSRSGDRRTEESRSILTLRPRARAWNGVQPARATGRLLPRDLTKAVGLGLRRRWPASATRPRKPSTTLVPAPPVGSSSAVERSWSPCALPRIRRPRPLRGEARPDMKAGPDRDDRSRGNSIASALAVARSLCCRRTRRAS